MNNKDNNKYDKGEKTDVQSLAEFFGWNRKAARKVKQTKADIAPNGTRRERRINNDFIPEDEDPLLLLQREINRENKLNKIYNDYSNNKN